MTLAVLSFVFFVTILIGVPIAFALGLAGLVWIVFFEGIEVTVLARRSLTSLSSFPLLSIPLFIMIGSLADRCGMLPDLVRWLQLVVGWVRGGRAYVSIVGSMIFSGISGTAVSDIATLGRIEIQLMKEAGYPVPYSAALVATCAILAPIIPPSVAMIIYALAAGNVSIGALFLGGAIPGCMIGMGLMLMSWHKARSGLYGYMSPRPSLSVLLPQTFRIIPLLVLPAIILGGIVTGVMTITESAAVGVGYVLFVGFAITRKLRWTDLYETAVYSAVISSVLGMLIATGAIVSWILTRNQVTQQLADFLTSITTDPQLFMVAVTVALLLLGMVMDATAITIALAPLLAPVARIYAIDDVQFGVLFVVCSMIGLITPPVGVILAMTSTVANVSFEAISKEIFPFVVCCVCVVALLIYFPALTTWLPRKVGL
jgi:tripartite ATP-independent transporter DctM subunit